MHVVPYERKGRRKKRIPMESWVKWLMRMLCIVQIVCFAIDIGFTTYAGRETYAKGLWSSEHPGPTKALTEATAGCVQKTKATVGPFSETPLIIDSRTISLFLGDLGYRTKMALMSHGLMLCFTLANSAMIDTQFYQYRYKYLIVRKDLATALEVAFAALAIFFAVKAAAASALVDAYLRHCKVESDNGLTSMMPLNATYVSATINLAFLLLTGAAKVRNAVVTDLPWTAATNHDDDPNSDDPDCELGRDEDADSDRALEIEMAQRLSIQRSAEGIGTEVQGQNGTDGAFPGFPGAGDDGFGTGFGPGGIFDPNWNPMNAFNTSAGGADVMGAAAAPFPPYRGPQQAYPPGAEDAFPFSRPGAETRRFAPPEVGTDTMAPQGMGGAPGLYSAPGTGVINTGREADGGGAVTSGLGGADPALLAAAGIDPLTGGLALPPAPVVAPASEAGRVTEVATGPLGATGGSSPMPQASGPAEPQAPPVEQTATGGGGMDGFTGVAAAAGKLKHRVRVRKAKSGRHHDPPADDHRSPEPTASRQGGKTPPRPSSPKHGEASPGAGDAGAGGDGPPAGGSRTGSQASRIPPPPPATDDE